jgi:hypothetical protein
VVVSTRPGLIATNTNPSALYSAAYFATTIFRAAFEMAYGAWLGRPAFKTASLSPMPLLRVTTFLAAPCRRRGRNELMVWTTPMTLTWNCTGDVSWCVYGRGLWRTQSRRSFSRRSSWPSGLRSVINYGRNRLRGNCSLSVEIVVPSDFFHEGSIVEQVVQGSSRDFLHFNRCVLKEDGSASGLTMANKITLRALTSVISASRM